MLAVENRNAEDNRTMGEHEETVNQIAENPYLQYFLGFPQFIEGKPFADSLITHPQSAVLCVIYKELLMSVEKEENSDYNEKDIISLWFDCKSLNQGMFKNPALDGMENEHYSLIKQFLMITLQR